MNALKQPHIYYGGDYNPEQWSEETWREDMRLMKQAGVNLVSIGIFSWALLQPNENCFDFTWLDKLLDLLAENGISAALATATAAQPAWLSQNSDILPVDQNGNTISYGSRQSYCPNSPSYRRFAQELVRRMAERYQNHPALAIWHVNNEYACHIQSCYCENCAGAFRLWLKRKYGTIEKLNEAWGTNFWSQHYYQWSEIIPPKATSTFPNPSQVLDYRRFSSDSLLECYQMEYAILKEVTPEIPVTTNFMGDNKPLDYFKWARNIDVISWDNYPDTGSGYYPGDAAFNHDLMRGLKNGQPFLLMEQAPNQVNWRPININKRPGVMRLISYQAVAHGADSVMFFQWRQSRKGAEKFHSGMVTHTGDDQSRVYREVASLGKELSRLDVIPGSRITAEVGILFDYDNWWAVEYPQRPSESLTYLEQVRDYYNPLFERNIPVDVLPVDGDFSPYKLVIAPLLYMVKPGVAERLEAFVAAGGTFITTFFSGIVDETDGVFPGGYPGPLRRLLGLNVEEYDTLEPHMKNTMRLTQPVGSIQNDPSCSLWCDVAHTRTARTLATFGEDYYAGAPCLTVNSYGKGKAYYVATRPEPGFIQEFLGDILHELTIRPALEVPHGVEAIRRSQNGRDYLFLLNHTRIPVEIALPNPKMHELITDTPVSGKLTLAPLGVAVLTKM